MMEVNVVSTVQTKIEDGRLTGLGMGFMQEMSKEGYGYFFKIYKPDKTDQKIKKILF